MIESWLWDRTYPVYPANDCSTVESWSSDMYPFGSLCKSQRNEGKNFEQHAVQLQHSQSWTRVLRGKGITVIMVHLQIIVTEFGQYRFYFFTLYSENHICQHVYRVWFERQIRASDNTKSVKLMPKCLFPDRELSSVRSIQAIDTIRTTDPVLQLHALAGKSVDFITSGTTVKEVGKLYRFFGDIFKYTYDILWFSEKGKSRLFSVCVKESRRTCVRDSRLGSLC